MWCPRCQQEKSVERRDTVWICHECNISFALSSQVIRPIQEMSIWVERGSGTRVRVLSVDGDPFDPHTSIRYQAEAYDESAHVMVGQDFRLYFRLHKSGKPVALPKPPCREMEEWESISGTTYRVIEVVITEGVIRLTPSENPAQAFWVRSDDFTAHFKRIERRTDYDRLLKP